MNAKRKFHPACTVKLQIRLEDFGADVDDDVPSEELPFEEQLSRLRRQEKTALDALATNQATRSKVGSARLRARLVSIRGQIATLQESAPPARAASEQVGDLYSVEFIAVPIDCGVELNSYRALDTAKFMLPFRDVPLDSQDARSALVEVYLGTVPAEDFATPDRWRLALDRRNILFRGYVDTWHTTHSDEDAIVEVEARSLECILHDEKLDPRARVFRIPKGGEPISAFVNRVMASVPATSGRTGGDQLKAIFYRANSEPRLDEATLLRGLQTVASKNAADPAAGGVFPAPPAGDTPTGATAATAEVRLPPAHAQDMRAWDLIVQACEMVGCVPIYDPSLAARGATLSGADDGGERLAIGSDFILIRPANTLYESVNQGTQLAGGAQDEFERTFPSLSSKPSQVRFLVWGRNITKLGTKRKLGRIKAPAIEVVSYNPDAAPEDRVMRVVYPSHKVVTRRGAKGEGAKREVVRKIVFGVRSREALEAIALGLYHAIGRNELEVNVDTDDMSSYVDPTVTGEVNPDVLTLRSGTPCRVVVARRSVETNDITLSPLSEIAGRNTDELRRLLLEQQGRYRPGTSDASRAALVDKMLGRITTTMQSARRTDVFYVRTIKHNWSGEDGWSAEIAMVNFVEARALPSNISKDDKDLDDKQRLTATVAKTRAFIASGRVRRSQGQP